MKPQSQISQYKFVYVTDNLAWYGDSNYIPLMTGFRLFPLLGLGKSLPRAKVEIGGASQRCRGDS
jgi:hypothetical protein